MKNEYLVHPDDITIDRKDKMMPTKAIVCDADGELIGMFDKKLFSDEHIREAICFANKAFAKGHAKGLIDKEQEFQRVLGLHR